jgi:hypothetical protein
MVVFAVLSCQTHEIRICTQLDIHCTIRPSPIAAKATGSSFETSVSFYTQSLQRTTEIEFCATISTSQLRSFSLWASPSAVCPLPKQRVNHSLPDTHFKKRESKQRDPVCGRACSRTGSILTLVTQRRNVASGFRLHLSQGKTAVTRAAGSVTAVENNIFTTTTTTTTAAATIGAQFLPRE